MTSPPVRLAIRSLAFCLLAVPGALVSSHAAAPRVRRSPRRHRARQPTHDPLRRLPRTGPGLWPFVQAVRCRPSRHHSPRLPRCSRSPTREWWVGNTSSPAPATLKSMAAGRSSQARIENRILLSDDHRVVAKPLSNAVTCWCSHRSSRTRYGLPARGSSCRGRESARRNWESFESTHWRVASSCREDKPPNTRITRIA